MFSNSHLRVAMATAAVSAIAAGLSGCGSQSPQQRIDAELKRTGKEKLEVVPFSGHVTIDGQPPGAGAKPNKRLVVVLNDVSKPDSPIESRPNTELNPQGDFSFSSPGGEDGIPPGTYVLTFAQLTYKKKFGYLGPDGLKNLYNDPEKNATEPELKVELKQPGVTNYTVDLRIAGKEAAQPGPKALTSITID